MIIHPTSENLASLTQKIPLFHFKCRHIRKSLPPIFFLRYVSFANGGVTQTQPKLKNSKLPTRSQCQTQIIQASAPDVRSPTILRAARELRLRGREWTNTSGGRPGRGHRAGQTRANPHRRLEQGLEPETWGRNPASSSPPGHGSAAAEPQPRAARPGSPRPGGQRRAPGPAGPAARRTPAAARSSLAAARGGPGAARYHPPRRAAPGAASGSAGPTRRPEASRARAAATRAGVRVRQS